MPFDESAALDGFQVLEDFVQIAPKISRLNKSPIRMARSELRVHGADGRHAGAVARRVGLRQNAVIENLEDVPEFCSLSAQNLLEQPGSLDRVARVRPLGDIAV